MAWLLSHQAEELRLDPSLSESLTGIPGWSACWPDPLARSETSGKMQRRPTSPGSRGGRAAGQWRAGSDRRTQVWVKEVALVDTAQTPGAKRLGAGEAAPPAVGGEVVLPPQFSAGKPRETRNAGEEGGVAQNWGWQVK